MSLEKLINNKKVVLTDLFDTLLFRKVQPEYVKKIWANHICKLFNLQNSMIDLYQYRNKIESELYHKSISNNNDGENTYKEITDEMFNYLKEQLNCSQKDFFEECKKIELEIEYKVLYIDDDIYNLLNRMKQKGKRIICVTDMFYSKDMIEKILENKGIKELFSNVYVSSEYKKNKKHGSLYKVVLDNEKLLSNDCVMIGDNYYSDYESAKNNGIEAYHIDRKKQYEFYEKFAIDNAPDMILKKFENLNNLEYENFDKIIFSLYSFIEKLYFELKSNDFKEVVFLSREGEFLKKLFDSYCSEIYSSDIESHYIYVSRKSTYLPSLQKIDKEDFAALLDQYSYITINEFLNSLNFNEKEIKQIEKEFSEEYLRKKIIKIKELENDVEDVVKQLILDFNKKIGWFKDSKEFTKLKNNSTFKKIYEEKRSDQQKLFNKYIKQVTNDNRIMVVDIGWNGSIQDNIQNILGDKYKIYGSYFGLCLRNNLVNKNKKGLVFSNYPYENKQYPLYMENRTIYEILCGASHGSANKYIIKNGKVEVELFSKKEEKEIYNNIVKKSQENMIYIFNDLCSILANGYYDNILVSKKMNKIQFDIMYNPTRKQLNYFNNIYHYENFGVFGFTTFNNKSKIKLKTWIKEHIKFFVKYPTYFYDTFWPVLKLHNNNMKIPYILYKLRRKKRYKNSDLF